MALVLGIDLETDGVNPSENKILEIGCALWDTDNNRFIKQWNVLVNDFQDKVVLSPIGKLVHQITESQIERDGYPLASCITVLQQFFEKADYIVAHNAAFEQGFIYNLSAMQEYTNKKWIDTMTDVPYPYEITVRSLEGLASAHGIINPFPHQALSDVIVMLQVMSKYDFNKIIQHVNMPTIKISCSPTNRDEEELAKKLGFRFIKEDSSYSAFIKNHQEQEFRVRVLEFFPDAFDPITRLIAQVSYDEREKAKSLDYKFEGSKKLWFKDVRQENLQQEIAAANGLFAVKIENGNMPEPIQSIRFLEGSVESTDMTHNNKAPEELGSVFIQVAKEDFEREMVSYYPSPAEALPDFTNAITG